VSRPRRRRRPQAIRALSYDYPSGNDVEPHTHPEDQLLYASAGVMTVRTGEGTWIVPPHRGVWIPAQVEHAIHMSGPVSMRTLYLPREPGASRPMRCRVLDVPPLLRELVLAAVARGGLDPNVREDENLLAVIMDQLRTLPERSLHLPMPGDPRAARVARRLVERPEDTRPAAVVVRGSGASQRTIERVFRREVGMGLGEWRRQLRLGRAIERLAAGESVTTVAIESGYDSVSAFISAFRSVFGRTPGRYFRSAAGSSTGSPAAIDVR
jgi:AraC-like DNA-binding protein